MNFFTDLIGIPLGYAVFLIHKLVRNYGFSIIVFTLVLRIIMLPLFVKQQKATIRLTTFKPLIDEINKKYRNNPKKKAEELQKLYANNKISSASGCLPMIVPVFLLFGMLDVVYKPLIHILHLKPDVIDDALKIFKNFEPSFFSGKRGGIVSRVQLGLINDVIENPSRYDSMGSEFVDSVKSVDLNFLGFNLGSVANLTSFSVIFPILALVFSFLQMFIMIKQANMPQVGGGATGVNLNRVMLFVMPLISFFITLSTPIGVSIYWVTGYVFQIFQSLLFNKFFNYDEIKQNAVLELERIKKNKRVDGKNNKTAKISNKDRLSLARKKLIEKYGE